MIFLVLCVLPFARWVSPYEARCTTQTFGPNTPVRFQAELLGVRGPGSDVTVYGSTRLQMFTSNIQDGNVFYESPFPDLWFQVSQNPLYMLQLTATLTTSVPNGPGWTFPQVQTVSTRAMLLLLLLLLLL